MSTRKRIRALSLYDILRRRMVHETEVSILYGLRFPERVPRIPTLEVGTGEFEPAFAAAWWSKALDLDPAPTALDPIT